MIRLLIRNDPTRFMVPFFWAIGVAFGLLTADAGNEDFAGYGPHLVSPHKLFFVWALVQTLMVTAYYFMCFQLFRIARPFEMSLPIDPRALWWSRMIPALAAALGGALIACGTFVLAYDHPVHDLQVALAANGLALAALVPFLYHSVRVRNGQRGMPAWAFVPALLLIIWLFTQIGMQTIWPGVLGFASTIVLAVVTHRRMPRSFELTTSGRRDARDALARVGDGLSSVPGLGSLIVLDRSLRAPGVLGIGQLFTLLTFTALLGIVAITRSPASVLFAVLLAQFAWFARAVTGQGRLAHLPIRRLRVFHYATLPGLLAPAAVVVTLAVTSAPGALGLPWIPAFVAAWALAWWLALSMSMARQRRPTPGGGAIALVREHGRLLATLAVFAAAIVVLFDADLSSSVSDAVLRLPLSLGAQWALASAAAAVAYLLLRVEFLHADSAPLPSGAPS